MLVKLKQAKAWKELSIQHFNIRLQGDAIDQVQEIRFGHIRLRFIHQGKQSRFHHVRAETATLQPRRDRDEDMQIALLQLFNVLGGGCVGDDDLTGEVIRHVLADLDKVSA